MGYTHAFYKVSPAPERLRAVWTGKFLEDIELPETYEGEWDDTHFQAFPTDEIKKNSLAVEMLHWKFDCEAFVNAYNIPDRCHIAPVFNKELIRHHKYSCPYILVKDPDKDFEEAFQHYFFNDNKRFFEVEPITVYFYEAEELYDVHAPFIGWWLEEKYGISFDHGDFVPLHKEILDDLLSSCYAVLDVFNHDESSKTAFMTRFPQIKETRYEDETLCLIGKMNQIITMLQEDEEDNWDSLFYASL